MDVTERSTGTRHVLDWVCPSGRHSPFQHRVFNKQTRVNTSSPPGPLRRRLALTYLHVVNREYEYVVLHRDTSAESDIKQRREIQRDYTHPKGGTEGLIKAEWVDQSAVRAALEGRILVIDGIEKAERNVLPVLNNLLENREIKYASIHLAKADHKMSLSDVTLALAWKMEGTSFTLPDTTIFCLSIQNLS